MLGKEMPSLTWKAANHLAIAYQPDKVNLEEIIPVAIEKDGQFSSIQSLKYYQQSNKEIYWMNVRRLSQFSYMHKGLSIYYVIHDGGAGVFPIYYNIT